MITIAKAEIIMESSDAPFLILLGIGAALAIGLTIFFIIVLRKSKDGPR